MPLPDESVAASWPTAWWPAAPAPAATLMRDELRERVRAALAALPARDREVLVLRYLEGLSTGEVAAVLGLGEGAVKIRQLRALERLRGRPGRRSEEDCDERPRAGRPVLEASETDPVLAELVEELTGRLQAGEPVDLEAVRPPAPRAGRAAAPAAAGHGDAGRPGPVGRPDATRLRPAAPSPTAELGDAGRLPDRPRGRPGRHGGRLRGRAGLAAAAGWR